MGGAGRAATAAREEPIRAGQRAVRLSAWPGVPSPAMEDGTAAARCELRREPGGRREVTNDSSCLRLPLAIAGRQRRLPTAITRGERQPFG